MRAQDRKLRRIISICIVLVFALAWIMPSPVNAAQKPQVIKGYFHEVREIETNALGISNPGGLAFFPEAETFQVISDDSSVQTLPTFTDLISVTIDFESKGSTRIPIGKLNPLNSVFDEGINTLFILDHSGKNIISVPTGADGQLQPDKAASQNIESWGLNNAAGMTINQSAGQLFILDRGGKRIVKVVLGDGTNLGNANVSEVDLIQLGIVKPEGVALDTFTGHIHILDKANKTIYETDENGKAIATRDLSDLNLTSIGNILFAPSYDSTDDPKQTSLYLTGTRQNNANSKTGNTASSELSKSILDSAAAETQQGLIVELAMYDPVALAASTFKSVLNNTIYTSGFNPPSPDPAGVEYLPESNTLLICDSEVDEMGIWKGVNLFETTLEGTLVRGSSTMAFSNEPTGVTYNSKNGHLFYSDDDARRIYEVAPDNSYTYFKTSYFGSGDPEGVAFDAESTTLYIADGVNEEVYVVKPGADGKFNNVAPYGDDQVTRFDTSVLGIHDPEGIGFNPATGHLYVVGDPQYTVAEVTTNGTLVQMIDISVTLARVPAGIGFAPSSGDQSVLAMYIPDRGKDNNSYPTENDGKVYELSMPGSFNAAPAVSISSPLNSEAFNVGDAVTFRATASDIEDGNLDSGITWTLSDGSVIGSGSSFTKSDFPAGTYAITASAKDSKGATGSASITITVKANTAPTVTISSPANGETFKAGNPITFSGTASDAEEGNLDTAITWTLSDGSVIGTGSSFTKSDFAEGTHTITASVTDSKGALGSANITITVKDNLDPTVSISSPTDGDTFITGDTITFSGTASDIEDGNLGDKIIWTLPGDLVIGNGSSFAKSGLAEGSHTITASVTDSSGGTSLASITITVVPPSGITTVTFPTIGDTTVKNTYPTQSFYTDTTLQLRNSTEKLRTYIKFSVTGLSATIQSAKIRLYVTQNTNNLGTLYLAPNNYKSTSTPWVESGLTWNNAPSKIGTGIQPIQNVPINSWVEYDVTSLIHGDGVYSFVIISTSSKLTVYSSSNSPTNKPEIVIENVTTP